MTTTEFVLEQYYSISQPDLVTLEGYDSVNYKVTFQAKKYVLKVYDYSQTTLNDLIGENQVIQHLGILAYDFPSPIKSNDNDYFVIHEEKIYRLLSFVEGTFLGDSIHDDTLFNSLGIFIAETNLKLNQINVPAIQARKLKWDLQHFLINEPYLTYIDNHADRRLAHYFFHQYKEQIIPIQYQLRKSIIHSDANHWNVLCEGQKVSGIIDFGDMCYTYQINDLAIAMAYVLMEKENPLTHIASIVKGYHKHIQLQEVEISALYYLIASRLCTTVCNSAYTKHLKPDSEYITISEKPAWDLLNKWITINPLKFEDIVRTNCGFASKLKKETLNTLEQRNKHIPSTLSLSYKNPIEMSRAALQYMYDAQGNTFLDAYNNIMITGHAHPKVIEAGQKTYARLNTNTRYLYNELNSYAEKLLSKFPKELNKIFFVNSGSAASDLAIRLATNHTQRNKVMVVQHGYHGNTRIGIDISHYKYEHKGGQGKKDHIIETILPDTYNGPFTNNDGNAGKQYAEDTIGKIKAEANAIACFIAEPIVGCGGQVPLAKDYLKHVYPAIRAQGGLCISDEVQVGFGRLGDYFWGYEMHDVVPDIIVLGKPIGNGHPMAAVVTTNEIAQSFDNGMEFFSSFGGNPVSCAIGHAVLDTIAEEQLQENAKLVGDYCIKEFKALQTLFSCIGDVRGSGLFLGIEIIDYENQPNTETAALIANELRNRFILISTDGPHNNVLKIKPPICFSEDNVDTLIKNIKEILENQKEFLISKSI